MRYEIEGGNLPVVVCYPEAGQTLCTESGAMSWMSPNMEMKTTAGGMKKALGRMFSGESIFLNEYTAMGSGGMIAFASSFPGSILPYQLNGGGIIVQKKSFLAMEKGLELSIYFQKRFSRGFFGGEGFIMQRISGYGTVFLEIDGYCKEYDLASGESILVDTGYLAAMSDTCTMNVETVKGAKNMFFGGEGLFHTRITGPGKVYLQSMPVSATVRALLPYLPGQGSDGGIKISLGD
ncbi:MAG: TIGR00266 family protein [Clostridia bacterium]|nr:TIGR00266 family protein [Clostridia bacterium]